MSANRVLCAVRIHYTPIANDRTRSSVGNEIVPKSSKIIIKKTKKKEQKMRRGLIDFRRPNRTGGDGRCEDQTATEREKKKSMEEEEEEEEEEEVEVE